MNEDTLLIFDHTDYFWKKHGTQFRWWILDLTNRYKTRILLITTNNIFDHFQNETLVKFKNVELGPLNEDESAELLLSYSTRIKTVDDINLDDSNLNLYDALKSQQNLIKWRGEPQYIIMLAKLLELNDFSNINMDKIRYFKF